MRVLLPVSRFRVGFEVASGRPFSTFEGLVLRAIARGARSIDDLRQVFAIHPRLLIDALVTLTKAGWLAVGQSDAAFVLTAAGEQASSEGLTPASLVVANRSTFLIMERLTGALASNDEVVFVTKKELGDKKAEWAEIPQEIDYNSLDEGHVFSLLPRKEGEWIRWIGPIDMITRGGTWVPLNVDHSAQTVIGLPDAWARRLSPYVLTVTEGISSGETDSPIYLNSTRHRRQMRAAKPIERALGQVSWSGTLSPRDWSSAPARDRLQSTLETAERQVAIVTRTIHHSELLALKGLIRSALQRGVSVDILWSESDSAAVSEELKDLAFHAKRDQLPGAINWQMFSGPVLAFEVIAQDGRIVTVATAGPLATEVSKESWRMALTIRQPQLVAGILRSLAFVWARSPQGRLSAVPDRWRRAASDVESHAISGATDVAAGIPCRLRLAVDHEVWLVMQEAFRTSQLRLDVMSESLGQAGVGDLSAMPAVATRKTRLAVGEVRSPGPTFDGALRRWKENGVETSVTLGLKANIVCCDDWVLISSGSLLADEDHRKIGVVVEGYDAVAQLLDEIDGRWPVA